MRRASSILKALSPDGMASASAARAASSKTATLGRCADQQGFRGACAPGLCGDAAEREARRADRAALNVEGGRCRHQREGEGGALAQLQVARRCARRPLDSAGSRSAIDQFAGSKHGLALRRRAGQTVEVPRAPPRAGRRALRSRPWRRGPPAARRSRTDAWRCRLAPAEDGMGAVLAADGVAAGARLAPVAGAGGVLEVGAARVLHQVAADGRGVAQLRRCAGQQRLGDRRDRRRRNRSSRARSALRTIAPMRTPPSGMPLDAVETGQAGDVDQPRRGARRRSSSGRAGWCRRRDRRSRVRTRRPTASAIERGRK